MCWCARCSPRNGWTALFLVTSLLTSATGCLFPPSAWSRHRFVDRAGGCDPGTLHLFISAARGAGSMRHHRNCHLSESLRLDRADSPEGAGSESDGSDAVRASRVAIRRSRNREAVQFSLETGHLQDKLPRGDGKKHNQEWLCRAVRTEKMAT